jgi:hypothetical protein
VPQGIDRRVVDRDDRDIAFETGLYRSWHCTFAERSRTNPALKPKTACGLPITTSSKGRFAPLTFD